MGAIAYAGVGGDRGKRVAVLGLGLLRASLRRLLGLLGAIIDLRLLARVLLLLRWSTAQVDRVKSDKRDEDGCRVVLLPHQHRSIYTTEITNQ